jgi:GT2 family glycosyltransferase
MAEQTMTLWMDRYSGNISVVVSPGAHKVIVCIPARNEEAVIGACLAALDLAARHDDRHDVTALVLVNNSDDDTAGVARRLVASSMRVLVIEAVLPQDESHAGGARRAAMNAALELSDDTTVLMSTDADSLVAADWISTNLGELSRGVDAVAGMIAFDAQTRARLRPMLTCRAAEWALADRHARLGTLIDPRPHDPWPTHIWAWGASLAITARAYAQVGGVPCVALCEDRALAAKIEAHDLKLRHSHAPVVFTSAREAGRAPGGFADLIACYTADPAFECDAALEPVSVLLRRLRRRARTRAAGPDFGARWAEIEASDPLLVRRRVTPDVLDAELATCDRLIVALSRSARHQSDIVASERCL